MASTDLLIVQVFVPSLTERMGLPQLCSTKYLTISIIALSIFSTWSISPNRYLIIIHDMWVRLVRLEEFVR